MTTADSIAESFEMLASESRWFARELDDINASRPLITLAVVDRLIAMGERLQAAAVARDRLTNLEADQLHAGIDLWMARRDAEATPPSM